MMKKMMMVRNYDDDDCIILMMIISSWWWLYHLDDDYIILVMIVSYWWWLINYITCKEVLSESGEEFAEQKAPSRCRRACLSIIQSSSCLGWWWWWWWYWRISWQLWSHQGLGKNLHFTSRSRGELSPSPTLRKFLSIAQKDGKSTSSKNIFQASLKRSDSFANTEFCNRTSKAHGEIQRLHKHILVKENPINHIYKLQDYCFTCLKLNTHTPPSAA